MNSKFKVLFIDTVHPILKEMFVEKGFICEEVSQLTPKEVLQKAVSCQGIIIRSRIKIDKQFIDQAQELKFIGRVGAGMENIDVEYAKAKGIQCFNSPEGNRDAVAEHAMGMLLSLMNNICRANKEVREGKWLREKNRGIEISGKTVGIIGVGNMGTAFAQRLAGFNVQVLGYDKYKAGYSSQFIRETKMEEIFEKADIVSLHVPLTQETEYLANDKFFSSFKKNIWIINTSRGKVVNSDDLVKNIEAGKIMGAALDVLEYEKFSFEEIAPENLSPSLLYLTKSDKVIFTPHIAGWTHESNIKLSQILADKIITAFYTSKSCE